MIVHFKTFIQVLMATLMLGVYCPQPACAAGTSEPGKTCCCTGSSVCDCHPDKPCKQSCTLVQVHTLDKQLPSKPTPTTCSGSVLLCLIAPTKISYPAHSSIVRQRHVNVSPPFGGSPPQAMLRLWLL